MSEIPELPKPVAMGGYAYKGSGSFYLHDKRYPHTVNLYTEEQMLEFYKQGVAKRTPSAVKKNEVKDRIVWLLCLLAATYFGVATIGGSIYGVNFAILFSYIAGYKQAKIKSKE